VKAVPLSKLITEARAGFASGADEADGVLQVRMHNVSREGGLSFTKQRRVPMDARTERFLLRPNDVLFNATNSPDLVGKTALFEGMHEPVVFSNHFLRLRVDEPQLEPAYLVRWMQWQHARGVFASMAHQWVNQASVRTERLLGLAIPLPPLSEQRRVAGVLDEADALRATRRTGLTYLEELAASAFDALFGEPAANPLGWDVVPVSSVVARLTGGRSFVGNDDEDSSAPYRVLRVSAVTSGTFLPDESRPVPRSYEPPPAHVVRDGDLLFSRANTTELVGAVALVDHTPSGLLLPDKIWRFVWTAPDLAVPEFIWQLFRSPGVRRAIARRATGTSGSMKNISAEKLMSIPVISPPVDLQRQFAEIHRRSRVLRDRAVTQLGQLDALFATLQHQAFVGTP
jgi:type I restriction enzyme, S subunit